MRVAIVSSGADFPLGDQGVFGMGFDEEGCLENEPMRGISACDPSGLGTILHQRVLAVAPEAVVESYRWPGGTDEQTVRVLSYLLDKDYGLLLVQPWLGGPSALLDGVLRLARLRGTHVLAPTGNLGLCRYPGWSPACLGIGVAQYTVGDPLYLCPTPGFPSQFAGWGIGVPLSGAPDGLTEVSGSAVASAHAAGVCARILQQEPGLTPWELPVRLQAWSEQWAP